MNQLSLNFNPRRTRNDSFRSITPELGQRQMQVLSVIEQYPHGISNAGIARILRLDKNQITPRVHELRRMNKVEAAGKEIDQYTKKTVITWRKIEAPKQ